MDKMAIAKSIVKLVVSYGTATVIGATLVVPVTGVLATGVAAIGAGCTSAFVADKVSDWMLAQFDAVGKLGEFEAKTYKEFDQIDSDKEEAE